MPVISFFDFLRGRTNRVFLYATWVCAPLPLHGAEAAGPAAAGHEHVEFRLTSGQPASTRRMIERLTELDGDVDPSTTMFFPDKAVKFFEARIAATTDTNELLRLKMPYALALLNNGQTEQSLREMDAFASTLARQGLQLKPEEQAKLLETKAIAFLRLAEQANCLTNHNADSCLLPIRNGGVHTDPRGSTAAIRVLEELLQTAPSPFAVWLLNIAHMTLGNYPDAVPPQWRVPAQVFDSAYDIKRFADVAGPLGLDVDDLSGGVVMEDFDRDGFLDLMVSGSGLKSPLRYFRNVGDGTFTELTDAAGLPGLMGGLNLIHGDYDNDGLADVLVLRGGWLGKDGRFPNSLLRNNGDHTFTDVTEAAGLLSFHSTQTAVWFDYDSDGWLDIFVGNESVAGSNEDPCELFRNNGDGTFTECAAANGVALVDWVKAVTSGDFNNDGRPDLYISSLVGPNRLLRNDGPARAGGAPGSGWRFTDVAAAAGVLEPLKSFPCWFFDYDNDGWLDLFVTGYSIRNAGDILADYLGARHQGERARLYHNNRDGTFSDVTVAAGLHRILHAMGSNFGDLDNDGWLDFYLGTGDPSLGTLVPNLMFRNDGQGRFQDVTTAGGFGQLQKGHGIAFGDLNHDGAQDIYSVVGGAFTGDHYHNQLFANPGHGNHWIKLQLEGVQTNRPAIGARVKVIVATPEGERAIHRVVSSGGSFGAASFRREIGLGAHPGKIRVEIFWPKTGQTQVIEGLAPDRCYAIREGEPAAREIALGSFPWPAASATPGAHSHQH